MSTRTTSCHYRRPHANTGQFNLNTGQSTSRLCDMTFRFGWSLLLVITLFVTVIEDRLTWVYRNLSRIRYDENGTKYCVGLRHFTLLWNIEQRQSRVFTERACGVVSVKRNNPAYGKPSRSFTLNKLGWPSSFTSSPALRQWWFTRYIFLMQQEVLCVHFRPNLTMIGCRILEVTGVRNQAVVCPAMKSLYAPRYSDSLSVRQTRTDMLFLFYTPINWCAPLWPSIPALIPPTGISCMIVILSSENCYRSRDFFLP
jgi:hypothetical protein